MEKVDKNNTAQSAAMHKEVLKGRTQQMFFAVDEKESNFCYPFSYDVDFNKNAEIDMVGLLPKEVNIKINELIKQGYGDITILNPNSQHGLGVGIINRLKLRFKGSVGYFSCGLLDGPNVVIDGRVGWSCGENMMAGTILVQKNGGSNFGAAIRGGDLVCRGDVGGRTGIDQKGGTIIVGGKTGAFSGFMMQRGRMVICGDAGMNLGDSMYDGTIYVGGEIESLGVDAVEEELNQLDVKWLSTKLGLYDINPACGIASMKKIVAGKQLWNYDSLEPSEKKLVL